MRRIRSKLKPNSQTKLSQVWIPESVISGRYRNTKDIDMSSLMKLKRVKQIVIKPPPTPESVHDGDLDKFAVKKNVVKRIAISRRNPPEKGVFK